MSHLSAVALQIDERTVTLEAILRSAAMRGRFDAIDEYIEGALVLSYASENGIAADPEAVQRTVTEWRIANGLYQASEVAEWLAARGLSMADLAAFARLKALKDQVRSRVAAGKVERYFAENRKRFDTVALSQIVVKERGLARELRFKLMEGEEFYLLARAFSLDEATRLAGGYVGRREREQLPRAIEAQAFGAVRGAIAGPLEVEKAFYVIKVEEIYPAELNDDTRRRIESLLFDDWLDARRKERNIRKPPLWARD